MLPVLRARVLAGCPTDVTVECSAVPAPASPTATDNCDPAPVITYAEVKTAGTCADRYSLVRTWTATDRCGNASSCSQTITVVDTTVPVLAGCPNPNGGNYQCLSLVPPPATVTANDACQGPVSVVFSETQSAPGSSFNNTITSTWTATDRCGNASGCSQTVTIVDTTPPVLAGCPPDVTAEWSAVPAPALVSATDNCDPAPVPSAAIPLAAWFLGTC